MCLSTQLNSSVQSTCTHKTGYALSPKGEELDKEIDEGFDDMSEDASDSPNGIRGRYDHCTS